MFSSESKLQKQLYKKRQKRIKQGIKPKKILESDFNSTILLGLGKAYLGYFDVHAGPMNFRKKFEFELNTAPDDHDLADLTNREIARDPNFLTYREGIVHNPTGSQNPESYDLRMIEFSQKEMVGNSSTDLKRWNAVLPGLLKSLNLDIKKARTNKPDYSGFMVWKSSGAVRHEPTNQVHTRKISQFNNLVSIVGEYVNSIAHGNLSELANNHSYSGNNDISELFKDRELDEHRFVPSEKGKAWMKKQLIKQIVPLSQRELVRKDYERIIEHLDDQVRSVVPEPLAEDLIAILKEHNQSSESKLAEIEIYRKKLVNKNSKPIQTRDVAPYFERRMLKLVHDLMPVVISNGFDNEDGSKKRYTKVGGGGIGEENSSISDGKNTYQAAPTRKSVDYGDIVEAYQIAIKNLSDFGQEWIAEPTKTIDEEITDLLEVYPLHVSGDNDPSIDPESYDQDMHKNAYKALLGNLKGEKLKKIKNALQNSNIIQTLKLISLEASDSYNQIINSVGNFVPPICIENDNLGKTNLEKMYQHIATVYTRGCEKGFSETMKYHAKAFDALYHLHDLVRRVAVR